MPQEIRLAPTKTASTKRVAPGQAKAMNPAAIGTWEEALPYAAWRWLSLVVVSALSIKSWSASAFFKT